MSAARILFGGVYRFGICARAVEYFDGSCMMSCMMEVLHESSYTKYNRLHNDGDDEPSDDDDDDDDTDDEDEEPFEDEIGRYKDYFKKDESAPTPPYHLRLRFPFSQQYACRTYNPPSPLSPLESLTAILIAHVSLLQGQLSVALGQIQALQARDPTHADDPEGVDSSA
ncbi:hypothetical protein Tco_0803744 [Tanacetum coccineum]|uniref:Uncharacterized protein n=1 Tax=Tanacetum coccineum TaxID=301880 RepID=A0ABQ5A4Y8_9ASTR